MKLYRKDYSELYGKNGWLMVELDEEYYSLRAIFKNADEEYTSNFSETEKFGLPEGCWEEAISKLEIISEDHFKETWSSMLEKHRENWGKIKQKLQFGTEIFATIKYFTPLGVVLDIDELFLGVANYDECKMILGEKKMYSGIKINLKVNSFDDENMWVNLSSKN